MHQQLGRYDLHEVIGTGGFATVYRATDPSLEATVAIKVLADNWSHDPEVRRRFRQEAVLLRRVQAEGRVPGIIEVFDIDETADGRPFFVMGWADRGTLRDRAGSQAWPPLDVVPVVEALGETLEALHAAGVVHRDLKPSNLLLRSDRGGPGSVGNLVRAGERLVVGDLGLAKDLTDDRTALSLAGGTEAYMAPEQRDPAAVVDHRADVYAASAVVKRLLRGEENHGNSIAIDTVLERAMAARPDDRHRAISEWRGEVIAALTGVGPPPSTSISTGTAGSSRGQAAPARGSVRRRVAIAMIGGLAVVSTLVAVLTLSGDGATSIVGPSTIEVGATGRYRVDVSADTELSWVDEAGRPIDDRSLLVTPLLPGSLMITAVIDGEETTRTVQAEASDRGPRISGPARGSVGTEIVFSASVPAGSTNVYWLDKDGDRVDDSSLRVVPDQRGVLTVAVIATAPDGIERGDQFVVAVDP